MTISTHHHVAAGVAWWPGPKVFGCGLDRALPNRWHGVSAADSVEFAACAGVVVTMIFFS